MKRLGKVFTNRLFLAFLGIVFLSLVIWFVGPLLGYNSISPLESRYNRLLAIGSMSALWFLLVLVRFIKSRRRNAQMLDSLASEEVSANDSASAEELQILQSKMEEAVQTLKSRNFSRTGGSRFIYELPWYVIIGPPGAGKTTLLSNSGLDFPLEETHGRYSVKGLGGTRNCDWWFTDQAVLLDTAGRYTTQDSEAEVDKSAWTGFLDMLRQKRSRRPINGVLLALSIEDILTSDDAQLEQVAKTLRQRIEELYNQLGIAPPVYLMFTKCDLLAGFAEYFSDLNKQEREQVWGRTLELGDTEPASTLKQGLAELSDRLNQQTVGRLQAELSQKNRENIYGFPLQFNHARQRIDGFISTLTASSRLLQPVLFRGVYFTSATQTGSVLDQVIQNVSQSFGIDEAMSSQPAGEGRSFFIHRLLSEVIFGESGLAGTNLKTEKRLKRLQWGAATALVVGTAGLIAFWTASYLQNKRLINEVDVAAADLQQSVNAVDPNSLDLFATNTVLNKARSLTGLGEDSALGHGFVIKGAGLYQGTKISDLASTKYDELLQELLLPRLMVRLEHQMHAHNSNSEFLFEALKTYQMIGVRDRFDSDSIVGWFNFDFDTNFSTDIPESVRAELKAHVSRLFRESPRPLPRPLDNSIIEQYQLIAANTSLAQRAYNRIRNSALRDINSHVRLSSVVSPELSRVFTREDGVSLDQSVQNFFTVQGYDSVFLPASLDFSRTLSDDTWVLGEAASVTAQSTSPEELKSAVTGLYYQDYIDQWSTLFSNLAMRTVDGLSQASEFVALIADTDSPLKKFLVYASNQTTLTRAPAAEEDPSSAEGNTRESALGSLLGTQPQSVAVPQIIDPVTQHFSTLHALVSGFETNTSTLDSVLNQLAELNIQLLPMAQSPAGTVDTQLNAELAINMQKLTLKADRLAEPLASLVSGLTNEISDVVGGGFCQQLDTAWKTDVLAYYQRAIRSRYPVNRSGTADIALTDFGAFFGPGGVIDTFVNTYLTGQVSRTPGQWTWVGKGSSVCLSDNSLKQLALADDIKNTFFSQGGNLPSFRFDLIPQQLSMSTDINHLFLDIGGSRTEYFHGPVNGATSFSWPSDTNNTQVTLRVEPVVPGSTSSISLSGPWSVLRLFERGARTPRRGGLTVTYNFGGRPVTLALATSSFNPLNSVAVRNFRAPESL
ncbi:MAG: type VI secretion system membrane subunit TssM [Granulosicoccus sp.]|nr:type VI secretion system membrane subunit TssM [Granulosicoccus sp.]